MAWKVKKEMPIGRITLIVGSLTCTPIELSRSVNDDRKKLAYLK